jgi:hypothetical protein
MTVEENDVDFEDKICVVNSYFSDDTYMKSKW